MRWTRPCRGWAPWTRPCPSARRWKRCSPRARGSCPRCARCSRTEPRSLGGPLRLRSRRSRLLPLGLALALALGACGSPATGRQVWFGPNMGSPDMIELFTQPPRWRAARQSTDVFKFYEQQLLADTAADCPDCGRNIYPQIARVEAFTRLNAWGLRIGIEVGVIKSWG